MNFIHCKCTVWWVSVNVNYMKNCNYHHMHVFKSFHPHRKFPYSPCSESLTHPSPGNYWSVGTIDLAFLEFHIDGIVYTVCSLLTLASFTQHNVAEIHPYCYMYLQLFRFYCWVVLYCTAMPPLMHPVTSLWTFGHLGCVQFRAFMNKAMNIQVQVLCCDQLF